MKSKLSLLILCWVVLILAILSIVTIGFAKLDFHWVKAICFFLAAVVVYGIILYIGNDVNNHFSTAVQDFTKGDTRELVPGLEIQRVYGMVLVTLLPFLVYILLLAVFLAMSFVGYGSMVITGTNLLLMAAAIGLGIIGLGTVIAFFIALRYLLLPPKVKMDGIEMTKTDQPNLWHLAETTASRIGAKPVDRIVLTPTPGVAVCLTGVPAFSMMGKGTRTLILGLPSLHGLKSSEFLAILAHEYGHLFNHDMHWGTFTYVMGQSLLSALGATPGLSERHSQGGFRGLISLVVSLNPAHWLLKSFTSLFFRITNSFSRMCEVMADINAMTLYGGSAFRSGLLQISSNDRLFVELVQTVILPAYFQESKVLTSLFAAMDEARDQTSSLEKKDSSENTDVENLSPYDTHPPIQTRLDYSKRFPGNAADSEDEIVSVFCGWQGVEEEATSLFNAVIICTWGIGE